MSLLMNPLQPRRALVATSELEVSGMHSEEASAAQLIRLASYLLFVGFVSPLDGADGNQYWDGFFGNPGTDGGGIAAIEVANNNVFIGGNFSMVNGITANRVARWDGTNWFSLGRGVNGSVYALAADSNYLYIAGGVYEAGGTPAANIARWDGTNWSGVGGGVNAVVFSLASDGQNLYAGGHFTTAGGVPASKIARWDGTNWYPLGQGIIPVSFGGTAVGAVDSIAVDGGSVCVGGRFRNAGGVAATNVAQWDGSNWHALGEGLRYINGGGSETARCVHCSSTTGTSMPEDPFMLQERPLLTTSPNGTGPPGLLSAPAWVPVAVSSLSLPTARTYLQAGVF